MHLPQWMLLALSMIAGSFFFRVRGGWTEGWAFKFSGKVRSLQLPGQLARLTWALACAATAIAAGMAWWQALALIPLAFVATTLPLWDTIDLGHNQGSFARDFAFGTLHGLLMGACLSTGLAAAHFLEGGSSLWFVPLVSGGLWAVCYALAWLRTDWSILTRLRLGKYGNPPEMAELLFGAQFGAALFLSVAGG